MQPENNSKALLRQRACARILKKLSTLRPTLGVILGTGFEHALTRFQEAARISYEQLPGFPRVGVKGHSGVLLIGRFGDVAVLVLSGRAHFYEGHLMASVTFPVGVLAAYGIRELLLTNAAGGINPAFRVGDFMCADDHINFMGVNPLRGIVVPNISPFVDLTETYDPKLRKLLSQAARVVKVRLHSGVYMAVCGPTYETPAEVHAFAKLGADAVGMSTVPEALVARQHGLKIAALSCITNRAASRKGEPVSHQHVLQTAAHFKTSVASLVETFAKLYALQSPVAPNL